MSNWDVSVYGPYSLIGSAKAWAILVLLEAVCALGAAVSFLSAGWIALAFAVIIAAVSAVAWREGFARRLYINEEGLVTGTVRRPSRCRIPWRDITEIREYWGKTRGGRPPRLRRMLVVGHWECDPDRPKSAFESLIRRYGGNAQHLNIETDQACMLGIYDGLRSCAPDGVRWSRQ